TFVPELPFTAPVGTQTTTSSTTIAVNGNDAANRLVVTDHILTIVGGWAPGTDLWLRWSMPEALTPSARSGMLSIDNLSLTAHAVPEPAIYAVFTGLVGGLLVLRRRRSV